MPLTDIVTLDGVEVTSAPVLARDCSFPLTDFRYHAPKDDLVRNFPVLLGSWADGMRQPGIKTQVLTIDKSAVTGVCDSPVVRAALTTCNLIAPDMAVFDLKTEDLELLKLVPEFCRQRNISFPNKQLRGLINADGSINMGNPYAVNYAKWAYSVVAQGLIQWITEQAIIGDVAAEGGMIDGLYSQIDGGWTEGSIACGNALNLGQTIDWGALTTAGAGPFVAKSPDAVTVAKNVTLFGVSFAVPAGLNFAQFLEDLWIPKVMSMVMASSANGDVEFEMHVPEGKAYCFLNTAACMQPCNLQSTLFDENLRERFASYRNTKIAKLYPSGRSFPLMETNFMTGTTMRFGPRSIGGNPTYGLFFKDMDSYFDELGVVVDDYGRGTGLPSDEPMLLADRDTVAENFQSQAFQHSAQKLSIKCVNYSALAQAGVLVSSRHLWLNITNIDCATFVSDLSPDMVFVEPEEE